MASFMSVTPSSHNTDLPRTERQGSHKIKAIKIITTIRVIMKSFFPPEMAIYHPLLILTVQTG
jgi:hypothetical protein